MFHLIYTSRALQEFSEADLKGVLEVSRSNNEKQNVTGMLLYHDKAFLQALEGDELSVSGVFRRIEKDLRHARVTLLRNQRSFGKRRIFGDWSMAFANNACNPLAPGGSVSLTVNQDLLSLGETQAMELLYSCQQTLENESVHV